jgi:ribosomal protein L11 methyltransferase
MTYELVIEVLPRLAEVVSGLLFECGAGGVEERRRRAGVELVVYAAERRELGELLSKLRPRLAELRRRTRGPVVKRVTSRALDDRWQTAWMEHLRQEVLTSRLVLQPVWDQTPPPHGKRRLLFEPKMAFGVGSHPTTQLAAESVERFCLAHQSCRVLDVGSGTGVLALVAAMSGARSALGVDVDPVAVESAGANAELNGLADRCRFERTPVRELSGTFDLVVANIELPALAHLAEDLRRLVGAQGQLSVTGFLSADMPDVADTFDVRSFARTERFEDAGWVLLELGR